MNPCPTEVEEQVNINSKPDAFERKLRRKDEGEKGDEVFLFNPSSLSGQVWEHPQTLVH